VREYSFERYFDAHLQLYEASAHRRSR
jgi:hypothetical protein